jgi:hypothetical protein
MSEKKPLNEGNVRDIQKGYDEPTKPIVKPTKPPPAPKPKEYKQ